MTDGASHAKIGQLEDVVGAYQDVRRLDVAVHDALLVAIEDGQQQLRGNTRT